MQYYSAVYYIACITSPDAIDVICYRTSKAVSPLIIFRVSPNLNPSKRAGAALETAVLLL